MFCEKAAADSNAKNEAFANVAEKKLAFLGRFGYGEFFSTLLGLEQPWSSALRSVDMVWLMCVWGNSDRTPSLHDRPSQSPHPRA